MTGKKSKAAKALAAEKKKENTNKAMDIIAKLKQNGFNGNVGAELLSEASRSFDSTTSKSIDAGSSNLDENCDDVATRIQSPPKKNKKTKSSVDSPNKNNKSTTKRPTRRNNMENVASTSKAIENVASVASTSKAIENVASVASTSKARVGISKKNSISDGLSKKTTKIFKYEIDCKKVKDTINVTDLQTYVMDQLKVDGKKKNLGSTVTVTCINQTLIIASKVYLPKRSLRFISKKFIKKSWNIQVASKSKNSYEFKYVGTA